MFVFFFSLYNWLLDSRKSWGNIQLPKRWTKERDGYCCYVFISLTFQYLMVIYKCSIIKSLTKMDVSSIEEKKNNGKKSWLLIQNHTVYYLHRGINEFTTMLKGGDCNRHFLTINHKKATCGGGESIKRRWNGNKVTGRVGGLQVSTVIEGGAVWRRVNQVATVVIPNNDRLRRH